MAIRPNNPHQNQEAFTKEDTSTQSTGYEAFKKSVNSPRTNFMRGGMFGAALSPTFGSESYNKLREALINLFKTASDEYEVGIIDLDKGVIPNLRYSCLVVTTIEKARKDLGVSFHILLIEATGDPIPTSAINIGGQQVENYRTASDAVDDVLIQAAYERVQRYYPNSRPLYCDATVVPRDFDLDNEVRVYTLALNSSLATTTTLNMASSDFEDLNLKAEGELSTEININFGRNQRVDVAGTPMRSDVVIEFGSRKPQRDNNQSLNNINQDIVYSTATGFIDLLWDPSDPMGYNQFYQNPAMAMQMHQKYAARLVITDLASGFGLTPGSVLLGLMTTLSLRDKNNWYQTFKPHKTEGRIDLADIGSLNIEANVENDPSGFGKPMDTKSASSSLEEIGKFLNMVTKPGLMVSLDCPESGPQSWYLSIFAAASQGSSAAQNILYNAANTLTGGAFERYFARGTPMFVDTNNRVHLGKWRDHNGVERDIRDFDHLAAINIMGPKDPKYIRDWSDTFLRTEIPLEKRLAARRKMIYHLSNETAEFTGFAERVTFAASFLDAVSQGMRDTGLSVITNTPMSNHDWNNQRGVAGFAQEALLSPATHSFGAYRAGGTGAQHSYQQHAWRAY